MSRPAPRQCAHESEGNELTHIDATGRARMVDVTAKPWTRRRAVARCRVVLGAGAPPDGPGETAKDGTSNVPPWSEMFETARLAGIQAAKQTSRLVPLCHALPGCDVRVSLSFSGTDVNVESQAEVVGQTGVEMEALTACAVSALTMVATLSRDFPNASIEELTLWEKTGGRSGTWVRT